jgi:hypothetical protein
MWSLMTTYCAPCLADLALVRDAVTAVNGTASCMAHAVLLTHPTDNAQRRLTRLGELRTIAEGKLLTASMEDQPALELLVQEYALAGAMDMSVPLREIAGDRTPRPPKARRQRGERGPRPEGSERGPRPEGSERGPRPERGDRPERGPRPERTEQPAADNGSVSAAGDGPSETVSAPAVDSAPAPAVEAAPVVQAAPAAESPAAAPAPVVDSTPAPEPVGATPES